MFHKERSFLRRAAVATTLTGIALGIPAVAENNYSSVQAQERPRSAIKTGTSLDNSFNPPKDTQGAAGNFVDTVVISGLDQPTFVRFPSDGKVYVGEKKGIIKAYDSFADTTPTIIADLQKVVYDFWDGGLMRGEFYPGYPDSKPYIFVTYNHDAPIGGKAPVYNDACPDATGAGCVTSSRLSRLTTENGIMTEEKVLVEDWYARYPSHKIGYVDFGLDGKLYIAGGDGASFTRVDKGQDDNPPHDPLNEGGALRSQDLETPVDPVGYNGTIIRLDPLTGKAPADNPLVGGRTDDDPIIAYGLRNPFSGFTDNDGNTWIADVGMNRREEINFIPAGNKQVINFGWPCYEGTPRQPDYDAANLPICENLYNKNTVQNPYYELNREGRGSAITGVVRYQQDTFPEKYQGGLFFANCPEARIEVLLPGADGMPDPTKRETVTTGVCAVELKIDYGTGNLIYVDLPNGQIREISHKLGNKAPTAVIQTDRTNGIPPFTVQFDGSQSRDAEGDPVDHTWDLDGDGKYDDGRGVKLQHTFTRIGEHIVGLQVTDTKGASDTESITITAGNTPPTARIEQPSRSMSVAAAGQNVPFSGSATDLETGKIADNELNWRTEIHHCYRPGDCHTHPHATFNGRRSGSFPMPGHGDDRYHVDLSLEVQDPQGLKDRKSVKIYPPKYAPNNVFLPLLRR